VLDYEALTELSLLRIPQRFMWLGVPRA
jgi:hypothetical protein